MPFIALTMMSDARTSDNSRVQIRASWVASFYFITSYFRSYTRNSVTGITKSLTLAIKLDVSFSEATWTINEEEGIV